MLAGSTTVGHNLQVHSEVARVEISVVTAAMLWLGDDVYIDEGTSIGVTDHVTIGGGCRIGPHVQIMDNSFHYVEVERRDERPPSRPISIGENVRIGPMAIVLPGASIGSDCVVGARSIVAGTIPPLSRVTGVPAKLAPSV